MIARIRSVVARFVAWLSYPDRVTTPEERLALHQRDIERRLEES